MVGCECTTLPSGHETTGTVLDLSGADNRQTIGYDSHGGDNQKVRDRPYTLHKYQCLDDAELTYATGTSDFRAGGQPVAPPERYDGLVSQRRGRSRRRGLRCRDAQVLPVGHLA